MKVTIIRSGRKTIAIQIQPDLTITVRAPLSVTDKQIEEFIRDKEEWIAKNLEKMKEVRAKYDSEESQHLTMDEINQLAEEALRVIPERVRYFAKLMGVSYGNITIRNQKTRWGSCSSKGNLNFNCLLMLTPPEVRDYVVVHELCHLKEMNHSAAFWVEVEKVIPNYKELRKWLKEEGPGIINRMIQM